MRDLLCYLKKYRKESIIAPLFKLLEAVFDLLVPLVVAYMIDAGAGGSTKAVWLSFGALLAGLCSGAGLGLAVLLKMNRSRRENGQIALTLYLISALCGLAVQLVF